MTLIAAVRCADGIAIAADSQETVGDYRKTVQKLSPLVSGEISVIITGAGNADLIVGFDERLRRYIKGKNIITLTDFVRETEGVLCSFYSSDVPLCREEDRDMRLFLAAVCRASGEYDLWSSNLSTLVPMGLYDLNGCDETLYDTTLHRLYVPGMTLQQGILAVLHTVVVAEETSNYVRGPIQIATVRENGIHIEDSDYTELMQARLKEYEREISTVFMACADTGINLWKFENILVDFCTRALALHKAQIDSVLQQMLKRGLNSGSGNPYPKVPSGLTLTIASGDLDGVYNEEQKMRLLKRIREEVETSRPLNPQKSEGQL